MGREQAIESAMAAIAERAAEPVGPVQRARHVLEALREVVPYDCAALALWDPAAKTYRPLANVDYPERVYAALHAADYRQEHVQLGMFDHRQPMRFRDLPCGGASVHSIADVAWPEGFREGLGLALFTRDDRSVGYLSLNTTSRRYPTDRQRATVGMLGPTLATVTDTAGVLLRRLGARPAVATNLSGPVLRLPGTARSPLLAEGAEIVELARRALASGETASCFLWRPGRHEPLHRVTVDGCEEDLPGYRALVSLESGINAYGLTDRELEVLTLMARGWTNARIAEALVNSPRTVSTHVERILEKLGATTRAEAAVRAVTERLLVWVDGEPPLGA